MYPFRPNPVVQVTFDYSLANIVAQANTDMFNAIQFARDEDFLNLLEKALSHGASINALNSVQSDVLTVAVNNNQPRKIQTLFAKGAKLPEVPNDEKDLLMIAAEKGNAELVAVLIDVAGFDINCVDSHGQTALHYAVKSGNKETVEVLLNKNANIDACSTSMESAERFEYFDDYLDIKGDDITPLMIAAAKSDFDVVELLLKNDADPHVGACLPLKIAMSKNDPEIMLLLLEHDTDPFYSNDYDDKIFLKNAVTHNHSIECLRLITAYLPLEGMHCGRNSALGIAVKNGNQQVVALLLASGYKPKDQDPEFETIWDIAQDLDNAKDILNLLAASRSDDWEHADITLIHGLLSKLPGLSKNPADLASEGLFPEIFIPCLPQLHATADSEFVTESPTSAQLCLQTAHALFHFGELDTVIDAFTDTTNNHDSPDSKWIAAIAGKKTRQAQLLLSAAEQLLGDMQEKLTQIMSLEFFLDCVESCPEHVNFATFISSKLREEEGIPDPIAEATGIAWEKAGKKSIQWQIAPDSLSITNRFVAHMAASMLEIQLNETDVTDEPLLAECKSFMLGKLHEQARPLISFCTNPVTWLRHQENRNNLKPVNVYALASAMQIELGLPLGLCSGIAEGWSKTIRQAQQSNAWRSTGELQRLLTKNFAKVLAGLFQAGPSTLASADFPVPAMRHLQLLAWCDQADVPIGMAANSPADNHTSNSSLRRPAEGEAPGAPPKKKPRI